MYQMEIAYCFHLIAAGCSDADGVETVISHCPSLSWIAADYFGGKGLMNLFGSCRLEENHYMRTCAQRYVLQAYLLMIHQVCEDSRELGSCSCEDWLTTSASFDPVVDCQD